MQLKCILGQSTPVCFLHMEGYGHRQTTATLNAEFANQMNYGTKTTPVHSVCFESQLQNRRAQH